MSRTGEEVLIVLVFFGGEGGFLRSAGFLYVNLSVLVLRKYSTFIPSTVSKAGLVQQKSSTLFPSALDYFPL